MIPIKVLLTVSNNVSLNLKQLEVQSNCNGTVKFVIPRTIFEGDNSQEVRVEVQLLYSELLELIARTDPMFVCNYHIGGDK